MRPLESGALAGLGTILGLGGGDATGETSFDDGNLQQVLDVRAHIRRKRASLATTGIFTTALANTHSGAAADTVNGTINPYTGASATSSPYPKPGIPETHDVWLLGFKAASTGVLLNFAGGQLTLFFATGSGYDASITPTGAGSAAVAGAVGYSVMQYTQEVVVGAFGSVLAEPDNKPLNRLPLPFRIPRGTTLIWQTRTTALGVSVYQMNLLLGVFPAGFGHDFTQ